MKVGAVYLLFVSPPLRLTNHLSRVSAIPIQINIENNREYHAHAQNAKLFTTLSIIPLSSSEPRDHLCRPVTCIPQTTNALKFRDHAPS